MPQDNKNNLQKELKEKVKEGVKPSDLKKLKRSKSADDINPTLLTPPAPPITKSKSQETFQDPKYPYTTLISQSKRISELEKETSAKSTTIKLLREKIDKLESSNNPPTPLLQDQLNEKQKQIEQLRKEKEELAQELELKIIEVDLTTQELDNSLIARVEANQSFNKIYQKLQDLKIQLENTEDEATQEFIDQDKTINQLRNQRNQFKLKVSQLERDLKLAKLSAQARKNIPSSRPSYSDEYDALTPLRYLMYSLSLLLFLMMLWGNLQKIKTNQK